MTARDVLSKATTEDELLQAITEAATYLGWRWHHVRRSDKALQMGHPGFPDLVLARKGRVLFLELKSKSGTVAPDQEAWLRELGCDESYPHHAAILIRPEYLDAVLAMLQ